MQFLLIVLLAVLAIIVNAKRPKWNELDGYSFEQYVVDFNFEVTQGSSEYAIRKALFNAELARVREHNSKNLSWREGINKFSVMTHQEKKAFFGFSKSKRRAHVPKYVKPSTLEMKPLAELPTEVDWRTVNGALTAVKDQGRCGSCWAFASTATIESHLFLQTGLLMDLSVQQMAMCSPNPDDCGGTDGCEGSTSELAFDYVAGSKGLVTEWQYPYNSYNGKDEACKVLTSTPVGKISGYVQLASNNYTQLLNAVANVGPVAISVDASRWGSYETGVFAGCNGASSDIDHAVVLVGYGEEESTGLKYYTIRNSWAPTWGESGFIRVLRRDNDEQNCEIDTTPQDGIACKGDNAPETTCGECGILFDSAYPIGVYL